MAYIRGFFVSNVPISKAQNVNLLFAGGNTVLMVLTINGSGDDILPGHTKPLPEKVRSYRPQDHHRVHQKAFLYTFDIILIKYSRIKIL